VLPTELLPCPGILGGSTDLSEVSVLPAVLGTLKGLSIGGLQMASGEECTDRGERLGVLKLTISLKMGRGRCRRNLSPGDAVLASESVKPGVQGVVGVEIIWIVIEGKTPGTRAFIGHTLRGMCTLFIFEKVGKDPDDVIRVKTL